MGRKCKHIIFVIALLVSVGLSGLNKGMAAASSDATNLGIANDFNIFVFNNHHHYSSDCEGRVAVGGEAVYQNYSIGNSLQSNMSTDRYDLVVGKKINIMGGNNFSGNTAIGTEGKIESYTMTNNNGVSGPIVKDVINFSSAYFELKATSETWASLPANGSVENLYGTLIFTGTDEKLNIFEVTTEQLSLGVISGIKFKVPRSSTVLVNVSGTSLAMGNLQMFYYDNAATGDNAVNWMWNFPELKTLSLQGMSVFGSMLAPDCTFQPSGSGNINGTVVFQNFINEFHGGYELHHYPFSGEISVETDVENKGSITIWNYDDTTKGPLKGAEFTIYLDGEVVYKGITDDSGRLVIPDLGDGTYEMVQTKVPEGYQQSNEKKVVTIDSEHTDVQWEIGNTPLPVDGEGEGSGDSGEGEGSGDSGEGEGSGDSGEEEGSGDSGEGEGSGDSGEEEGSGDSGEEEGSGDSGEGEGSGDSEEEEGSGDNGEEEGSGDSGEGEGSGGSGEEEGSGDSEEGEGSGDNGEEEGSGDSEEGEGSGDNGEEEGSGDSGEGEGSGGSGEGGTNPLNSTELEELEVENDGESSIDSDQMANPKTGDQQKGLEIIVFLFLISGAGILVHGKKQFVK